MKCTPPKPITLTAKERRWFDQIEFRPSGFGPAAEEKLRDSCNAAKPLALSLLGRGVVPKMRLHYFSKPGIKVTSGKKSPMEVFESNGTKGAQIFEHPHFLPYLRYWICGPVLPPESIEGVCSRIHDKLADNPDGLCAFARAQTRQHELKRTDAAEEFYKLGIELGLDNHTCRWMRDSVMQVR